ncbi:hypothetical protein Ddc_10429 [Ditylenchus destructor]|nr:hypothetical protein Ddc_10429 [Ditylenchus destructor]
MARYSQSLATLSFAALCILGCSARPHGNSNEEHDGPQNMMGGGGGMPGGGMMGGPMMGRMMSAMAKNPFLNDLDKTQRAEFFSIKLNTTLTKGQIVSAVNNWLQSLPANTQSDYATWQANVTQWKTDMINKLKSNLSSDAQALIEKIQGIMEDQGNTYKDTCHEVLQAVNETTKAVKDELKEAAKANFGGAVGSASVQGGPGGRGMGGPGMGGPGMGGPGMGGPGMGGPGMGGPGMGGPGMGMGGAGGDPCEMMENMVEHMGKMASMMHSVPDGDDDDVAPEVPPPAAADAPSS